MTALGYFNSLAIILLIVVVLTTSLVHCILSRLLNTLQLPLTSQMVSSRLDVKGLTDPTTCINICYDDATVGNSSYMTICLNDYVHSCIVGHTLSLWTEREELLK